MKTWETSKFLLNFIWNVTCTKKKSDLLGIMSLWAFTHSTCLLGSSRYQEPQSAVVAAVAKSLNVCISICSHRDAWSTPSDLWEGKLVLDEEL